MCIPSIGRIVSLGEGDGPGRTAQAEVDGEMRTISLACLPDARIGDYVSLHAGFALAVLSEKAARSRIGLIAQLHELESTLSGA